MPTFAEELELLFEEAKSKSEFDFVEVLINYRGMATHKLATNLYEWFDAIEFYKKLYAEFKDKEKARMALLIYSTFFENSDFYNIVGSLCKVSLGYSGSSFLFWKTKKYERLLGIGEKQDILQELLFEANKLEISNFFSNNHFREIRNTFFHSAYVLTDKDYILHDSEPIIIGKLAQSSISINDFLYPIVDNVISFFDKFKDLYLTAFSSYTSNKIVIGNFPDKSEIEILGSNTGLKGFRKKDAVEYYGQKCYAGIWYSEEYDMYAGHNININFPNIETIEISEQLTRYEKKDDIRQSDTEFHNLVEKIDDRQNLNEIARATALLLNFGHLRYRKMQEEENIFKKKSLRRVILPFFKKALNIGSKLFDNEPILKLVAELERA